MLVLCDLFIVLHSTSTELSGTIGQCSLVQTTCVHAARLHVLVARKDVMQLSVFANRCDKTIQWTAEHSLLLSPERL